MYCILRAQHLLLQKQCIQHSVWLPGLDKASRLKGSNTVAGQCLVLKCWLAVVVVRLLRSIQKPLSSYILTCSKIINSEWNWLLKDFTQLLKKQLLKNLHNIKFTVLTTFKCTIQWYIQYLWEKKLLRISGPTQLKPVLFKGQLYLYIVVQPSLPFISRILF